MNDTFRVIDAVISILLAAPALLLGWRLGWRYFQHFVSRSQKVHTSNASYFLQRLQFAGGAALILGGGVGFGSFYGIWILASQLMPQYMNEPDASATQSAYIMPGPQVAREASTVAKAGQTEVQPADNETLKSQPTTAQWLEKLDEQCSFKPESVAGEQIPSMLLELKEQIFEAAELRAELILEHKAATAAEKKCAEAVIGAVPTLKASVVGASSETTAPATTATKAQ